MVGSDQVCDRATGSALFQLEGGHSGMIRNIDFASRGGLAVSGGDDSTLVVWDVGQAQRQAAKVSKGLDRAKEPAHSGTVRLLVLVCLLRAFCSVSCALLDWGASLRSSYLRASVVERSRWRRLVEMEEDLLRLEETSGGKRHCACGRGGS